MELAGRELNEGSINSLPCSVFAKAVISKSLEMPVEMHAMKNIRTASKGESVNYIECLALKVLEKYKWLIDLRKQTN